jgi:chromosome partitioning protein
MIIVAGGVKGGGGKTTVATNLAIIRSSENRDVLLVDADDQETASDFTIIRNERQPSGAGYTSIKLSGAAVRTETQRLTKKYQDIIIDTGGRDTTSQRAALSVADLLIVPFVPRSFDVWTIEKVATIVGEMRVANHKLQAYTFINRADPRGNDNDEVADILRENKELIFIGLSLGNRKAFANAAADGLAVTELRPQDPKATEEMVALGRYIFDIKNISKKVVGE